MILFRGLFFHCAFLTNCGGLFTFSFHSLFCDSPDIWTSWNVHNHGQSQKIKESRNCYCISNVFFTLLQYEESPSQKEMCVQYYKKLLTKSDSDTGRLWTLEEEIFSMKDPDDFEVIPSPWVTRKGSRVYYRYMHKWHRVFSLLFTS